MYAELLFLPVTINKIATSTVGNTAPPSLPHYPYPQMDAPRGRRLSKDLLEVTGGDAPEVFTPEMRARLWLNSRAFPRSHWVNSIAFRPSLINSHFL